MPGQRGRRGGRGGGGRGARGGRGRGRSKRSGEHQRAPKWVPDGDAPQCMRCKAEFTWYFRRHHCRGCGFVVCGPCSEARIPIGKYKKAVRVCKHCFKRNSRGRRSADAAGAPAVKTQSAGSSEEGFFDQLWLSKLFSPTQWFAREPEAAPRDLWLQEMQDSSLGSALTRSTDNGSERPFPSLGPSDNIILDVGSASWKSGRAGDEAPRAMHSAVVGRPKVRGFAMLTGGSRRSGTYIGSDAQEHRGILKLTYPISHDVISNWDDVERLLDYTFGQLRVESHTHPLVLSEAVTTDPRDRRTFAEILVEKFQVPAFYFAPAPSMALLSTGQRSGIVVDCADAHTSVTPVYESHPVRFANVSSPVAGRSVTEYMSRLLALEGTPLPQSSAENELIRDMKEQLCYVSLNFPKEAKSGVAFPRTYQRPDDSIINVGNCMFEAPELLFQPQLNGMRPDAAIHNVLASCIKDLPKQLRGVLGDQIVVTGGSTILPGLPARLQHETMRVLGSKGKAWQFSVPDQRQHAVFRGLSMLSCFETFPNMLVPQSEYHEHGARIVDWRCF